MEKIRDLDFRDPLRGSEDIVINRMFDIELKDEELWLHVKDVRGLGLAEKIDLMKEGLRRIAVLLTGDDRFRNIDVLSGMSWIITKNPGLLRRLGFTIDNSDPRYERGKKMYYAKNRWRNKEAEHIEPSYAYIPKDKLLELYG